MEPDLKLRTGRLVALEDHQEWIEMNSIGYVNSWFKAFNEESQGNFEHLRRTWTSLPSSLDDDGRAWDWIDRTYCHGNVIKTVLDVGCNTGQFAFALADKKGFDVTAIDMSHLLIGLGKGLTRTLKIKVRFEFGDALNMPFADNSFDMVISKHVLEHLQNPDLAMKEMKRVSKQVVTGIIPKEHASGNTEHLYHFDVVSIKELLDRHFTVSALQEFDTTIALGGYVA